MKISYQFNYANKIKLHAISAVSSVALLFSPFSAAWSAEPVVARVALSGGLDKLDPSASANGTDLVIITQIYETLLEIDHKTKELKPKLAESFRAVSPTVWEVKLRKGIKFHDGSELTSDDVKFSIERVLNKDLSSPHYSQLSSISQVRIIDPYTLQIETKNPDPVLMRRMQPLGGSGRLFIMSKKHSEGKDNAEISNKPMGTGPYMLENWEKGRRLTLAKFPGYWGNKPDIDKGVFTFIPENSTRVNALLQKEVDVIQRLPISDVERVKKNPGTHVVYSPTGLVHTLLLDSSKPPFNDINVRKAFAHAIDIKDIVDGLLGEYGRVYGVPMSPAVSQYVESIQPYKYDPELSKKLLKGKSPIKLDTFTSDGRYVNDRDFYNAINSQLKKVGFDVTPQTIEWGRLISMMQKRSAGPFYIIGWDFGEGDASKINSFLHSSSALSITQDAEFDRLASLAGQETDEAKRKAIFRDIQKYVHDQYFIAAVWEAGALYGFSKKFNWVANSGDMLMLSEIVTATK